jgi:protein-disulfide isomerase
MSESNEQETAPKRKKSAKPATKPGGSGSLVGVVAIAALGAGVAVGWGARGYGIKADPGTQPAAAASAGAGPCDGWSSEICQRTGATSEGCAQAKHAAGILPTAACVAARAEVDQTVTKLKAARSSCDTLVQRICADLGEKTETCGMVREKTASFPTERCKEMLENFDEVIPELRAAEQEKAPLPAEVAQRQAAGDGPGFGPRDARLTIVEYSDFECPFCGRAADTLGKIREKYGTKVRFVFRQFPLQMHRNADLAAQASLAAHAQGKFWPFHDLLFQNQRDLERPSLEKFAQKAGLDLVKFRKALDEQTYESTVQSDLKLGAEAHVSGTPTVYIGAERVENAIEFDAFSREIDRRLAALDGH